MANDNIQPSFSGLGNGRPGVSAQAAELRSPGGSCSSAGPWGSPPSSVGEWPVSLPVWPILSPRLAGFCATVVSDRLSSLGLTGLCRKVWFPCGSPVPLRDQNERRCIDKWQRGDSWDMVLVALFVRPSFWFSISKPSGNTLSVFPLNTNQATLPTHVLCQTCQLLRGPWTACRRCFLLLLWWCVVSPFSSSAFVLQRGVNTEVPAIREVLTETVKLTRTIQCPS